MNMFTACLYTSTAIGSYWSLVRFVLCEHLGFSDDNLALDVLHADAQAVELQRMRRVAEGERVNIDACAVFLASGSCTVNGKVVHSPAIVGAATLLAGMDVSTVIRQFVGGENCSVIDVALETLCSFHTLVGVACIMVQDCDLFLRLGLSRHYIHSGRTLPRECHLLVSGRLAVEKTVEHSEETDGPDEIGSVTLVGTEYLYDRDSDARYVALRDCECVRITKAAYNNIVEFDPSAGQQLAKLLHIAQKAQAQAVNAAIVGVLFCPDVARHEATDVKHLLDSKSIFNAQVVDVHTVRAALGKKHRNVFSAFDDTSYKGEMAAAWLANLEKSVSHLIVLSAHLCASSESDLAENVFAEFITTHCDRILLFCKPNSTTISNIEKRCFASPRSPRTDLVILHEANSKPQGTRFLLGPRNAYVNFHHHVIGMDERDFCRVHRYLLGTTTGLILGGGGARGLAHLGVFKALRERNVEIDFVGGTSQGAFMGALLAGHYRDMGAIAKAVSQFSNSLASRLRVFKHGTLPLVSLAHGYKFTEYIRRAMPCQYIEDLHVPFFCSSSNVTTARVVYHHIGPLWKYVRASMTIIGLFPPVWDDGHLLVDGGYLDNLPVLYMRTILGPACRVIAVDVENKDASAFDMVSPYEDGLSGLYLFMRRLLTIVFGTRPFHHPAQDAITSQLLYAQHIVRLQNCLRTGAIDLYIRPPFIDYVWIGDYHKHKQMDRRGYLHTREVLDQYLDVRDSGSSVGKSPAASPTRRASAMPSFFAPGTAGPSYTSSTTLNSASRANANNQCKRPLMKHVTSENFDSRIVDFASVIRRKAILARAASEDH